MTIRLAFDRGTLTLDPVDVGDSRGEALASLDLPGARFDPREETWRAPAYRYAAILSRLSEVGFEVEDHVPAFQSRDLVCGLERTPFPYQSESVQAWEKAGGRGVVVLPTGAGKTYVAQLIMERIGRDSLVVTPTIDLMRQWYTQLSTAFDREVGLVGGGYHDPRELTVTTYDSAYIHMEKLGNRYGLVVFDECHHLPGPSYRLAAECCVAPFRLGLSATPEREDGGELHLFDLIGPVVHRKAVGELAGHYLADYEVSRIQVRLSDDERDEYQRARSDYLAFLREERISMGTPSGWTRFLAASSQSARGRRAFKSYRRQKAIAQGSGAKIRFLERLLATHRGDRVLVFTSENETVHRISRHLLVPAITHQTKVKERHEILERFGDGRYPVLVTSKVLNEGVDVPEANVAVVLSGSGSVREHVQRLGRILRRAKRGRAVLYELVAENTAEEFVSSKRRKHEAYD